MNVDMLKYSQEDLDTALEMTRKQVRRVTRHLSLKLTGTAVQWEHGKGARSGTVDLLRSEHVTESQIFVSRVNSQNFDLLCHLA